MLLSSLLISLSLNAVSGAPPTKEETARVLKVINERASKFTACTRTYLAQTPGAVGDVQVNLTLDERGYVKRATATAKKLKGARTLNLCLESVGRSLRFPKPAALPASVAFPVEVRAGVTFWAGPRPKKGPGAPR